MKPRLLTVEQWRQVREQRRDLDDEAALDAGDRATPLTPRRAPGRSTVTIPCDDRRVSMLPAARRPYPQEIDRARAWGPPTAEIFEVSERSGAVRSFWFCKAHIAGCLKNITVLRLRSLTAHGRARFDCTRRAWTHTLTSERAALSDNSILPANRFKTPRQ